MAYAEREQIRKDAVVGQTGGLSKGCEIGLRYCLPRISRTKLLFQTDSPISYQPASATTATGVAGHVVSGGAEVRIALSSASNSACCGRRIASE